MLSEPCLPGVWRGVVSAKARIRPLRSLKYCRSHTLTACMRTNYMQWAGKTIQFWKRCNDAFWPQSRKWRVTRNFAWGISLLCIPYALNAGGPGPRVSVGAAHARLLSEKRVFFPGVHHHQLAYVTVSDFQLDAILPFNSLTISRLGKRRNQLAAYTCSGLKLLTNSESSWNSMRF